MAKIRILPDHLANQIAAGEVVERPASVIKEMVENSLDAGSTRIEVEIEGGGVRLMRIIDNGCGMDEDDLLMSLERHGTSKIEEEEDLGAINTLGFRGEAIPSIGSVAKLTMTSRVEGAELGTKIVYEYGKLLKVHEIGCATGTTIEVRNLFGQTPARRKFLRTARTELGHIEEVIRNYALGCRGIDFVLRVDGRETMHFDARMTPPERLAKMTRFNGDFIPVSGRANRGSELERRLEGWLLPPENPGPARLRLFVNGRAVRDRMMIHAVNEGLRGFLMKGKGASGLLLLTVNPEEVDVNVHPAKHEVRFRNAGDVHAFLENGVREAMNGHQRRLQERIFSPGAAAQPPQEPPAPATFAEEPWPQSTVNESFQQNTAEKWTKVSQARPAPKVKLHSTLEPETPAPQASPERPPTPPTPQPPAPRPVPAPLPEGEPLPPATPTEETIADSPAPTAPRHNLKVIGVFAELYILCEGSAGMVVIDQHAAHERLLYEKLRRQFLGGRVTGQNLLFPETVELTLFQSRLVEQNLEELTRMGFSLRDFGGTTWVVAAIPALAGTAPPRELLLDALEQFGSQEGNRSAKEGDILDNILATMACKAAVKANMELSREQIDALLNDMAAADLFSHCPHGRPVVRLFPRDEVKKWFLRT